MNTHPLHVPPSRMRRLISENAFGKIPDLRVKVSTGNSAIGFNEGVEQVARQHIVHLLEEKVDLVLLLALVQQQQIVSSYAHVRGHNGGVKLVHDTQEARVVHPHEIVDDIKGGVGDKLVQIRLAGGPVLVWR